MFKGTPKLVSEPSFWTPLGKLHPPEKGKLAIVFPDSEDEMEVLITEVAYSEECGSIGYYWEENGKKQYETFPVVRLKNSPPETLVSCFGTPKGAIKKLKDKLKSYE